jgi:pimeloyl-ACP methyl ester carboxylesterase
VRLAVPDDVVLRAPGFGQPGRRSSDLTPPGLAEKVLEELHGKPPVVLAGHSSSCQVVAHAARRAPELVRALVLVGPTTDPRATTWPRLALRWLATAAHEDPRQVPSLVRQYTGIGLMTMARAMDQARRDHLDRTLRDVSCRVVVIRGRHDRICPADWAASLSTHAVTLPAGGHMVPWTHGKAVAEVISRFTPGRLVRG